MRQLRATTLELSALELLRHQWQRLHRVAQFELAHLLSLADVATKVTTDGLHRSLCDDA